MTQKLVKAGYMQVQWIQTNRLICHKRHTYVCGKKTSSQIRVDLKKNL